MKLWPVLGFLNPQVESKASQVLQRCLLGRIPMDPKIHFPKLRPFSMTSYTRQKLHKKRNVHGQVEYFN